MVKLHRETQKIVITGIGAIASNGIGKDAFFNAIMQGHSGIGPIASFDACAYESKTAAEIKDFDPTVFLGQKGLRTLDRSTKLITSTAKLALDDAGFTVTEENTHDVGVVVGSTFGSLPSICEFDKEALREGPQYVNPALFPNTVINSPSSHVSIKFNIKGFNTTIATGANASLDGLAYACEFLRRNRAKAVLVGGVEEFCPHIFLGFYKQGCLARKSQEAPETSFPFDLRRNGVVLGEGACVLLLEKVEDAQHRQGQIYAEVSGNGMGFGEKSLSAAMQKAFAEAHVAAENIDGVFAAANSSVAADIKEASALRQVFGEAISRTCVTALKSVIGETFSAAGMLQVAAACASLIQQKIPATLNYQQEDPECQLPIVIDSARSRKLEHILVDSLNFDSRAASTVVSRYAV
ncbi:MAG: beta-ketoacyl-[acyl-carrier-protein] synthase family protein [Candidatus Omnitrophica bacterium]|nr:beta-ketoacyl-[acyl-carrier-protein] synthase family protein [Candidatus Omnitrophota bacterium]